MKKLTDGRLRIFNDVLDDSYIIETTELTFARINKIKDKWYVWFYRLHRQESFTKLREALGKINSEFIKYFRGDK